MFNTFAGVVVVLIAVVVVVLVSRERLKGPGARRSRGNDATGAGAFGADGHRRQPESNFDDGGGDGGGGD
ncbi:hypothetical protein E2F46_07880 [Luteimonas aestuarii]|uniref:Uncharacterized protein n=1 Tax=Luteimonas aestuarii TaxID=453837 RepID=A0A4R5TVF2_9GAMM|nr:hypothetical protein [Luteimonas aestuarii]TDK25076.1 hypothetical protein E2F46_07880 [Luteimonas aestuarii]